ncbi:reverse transcriptase domain-containing protein [Tanacetum coccineum]
MNANCSAVILKKLPEKLGDPGRFLIPCDFGEFDNHHGIGIVLDFTESGDSTSIISDPPSFTPFEGSEMILEEEIEEFLKHDESLNMEIYIENFVMRGSIKIHEVIKKEVIKLLDAGLIYPISDSPWVSPVHCVPKKGGMTVVMNDDNELMQIGTFTSRLTHSPRKRLPLLDLMGTSCLQKNAFGLCKSREPFKVLDNLDKMLNRCEETNLVLNWEKCHFMVKEGIVLGHKISKSGLEVDRAKVDVLDTLTDITLLVVPNWDYDFEIMCDASDFALGAVLGQRKDKHFHPIHYASKTMTGAQLHYTTTEKEMLAVVDSFTPEFNLEIGKLKMLRM